LKCTDPVHPHYELNFALPDLPPGQRFPWKKTNTPRPARIKIKDEGSSVTRMAPVVEVLFAKFRSGVSAVTEAVFVTELPEFKRASRSEMPGRRSSISLRKLDRHLRHG
jgi:hypothetical protein